MVAVLNFGSQFAHLIARRVRELGVHAEILPFDTPAATLRKLAPEGIILSGGPASVLEKKSPHPDTLLFNLGVPILGICYGHQVMAHMLGGRVALGEHKEFGKEILHIRSRTGIFKGLSPRETVWFSHGDQVVELPRGCVATAHTARAANAAFVDRARRLYGIQFHPEVTHTKHGMRILRSFLDVCGAKRDWRPAALAPKLVDEIRATVEKEHVVVGISGGVDSLVAATLIYQAIGDRLHANPLLPR